MEKRNYVLIKKNKNKEIIYIDYDKLQGYKLTPRNKVKYKGILVNKLILIKPSFIEKILVKKTKRRLEKYLYYIINYIEDEDDTDKIEIVLNELSRYKKMIENNYRIYLDKNYYNLLLKKINLIENELQEKLFILNYPQEEKKVR